MFTASLLIIAGIGSLNNIIHPKNSINIVNALPAINLQNSLKFSVKPLAWVWKTHFLLVKYANKIDNGIAIRLAMFSFICIRLFNI